MYEFLTIFIILLFLIPLLACTYIYYQEWKNEQELKKSRSDAISRLLTDLKPWEEPSKSYRWTGGSKHEISDLSFSRKPGHHLKTKDANKERVRCKERDRCPVCKEVATHRIYFCQYADSKCENGHIWHYVNNTSIDTLYKDGEVETTRSHYLIGSKKDGSCSICQGKRKWYPLVPDKYPIFKYLPITEKAIQKMVKRDDSSADKIVCPECGLQPVQNNLPCKYGCFKCPNLHQWHHEDNLGNIMHECPHCIYKNNEQNTNYPYGFPEPI